MGEDLLQHVLLVSFPGQGHVNPLLRLAKRVASEGLFVTFSTNVATGLKMLKATKTSTNSPIPVGNGFLRFEFFDDGWDPNNLDFDAFIVNLNSVGPRAVADLICRQIRPVSFIISNPFLPWVVDIAAEMSIRNGVLWVQSCAVFSAYYHYFHSRSIFPDSEQAWKDVEVKLPALPVLRADDLPNFLLPSAPYRFLGDIILEQFANLSKVSWVLVDSFQELEQPIIESMLAVSPPARLIPVGPLYKLANRSDLNGVRGDLWETADCLGWLDSHPPSSVIYVSFGSVVVLGREQLEEIARGLQASGRPFLWVVKPIENSTETGLPEGFVEETAGIGMVVQWCPQEKVLSHPSVACFMTHCGWNSSMESLSSGVPIIAFPQFGDQTTNAKFLVDVYGVGVRLRAEEKLVRKEEVVRCVEEMFSGERAEEMKGNALKWKDKAGAAVREDGSSDRNVKDIVDDVKRGSPNGVDRSSRSQWETGLGKAQVGFGSLEETGTLLCK